MPDRQVLVDADGQEAGRRSPRQARQEHDRAPHRPQMKKETPQKRFIYRTRTIMKKIKHL